jgi:hypothetical protein
MQRTNRPAEWRSSDKAGAHLSAIMPYVQRIAKAVAIGLGGH